MTKFMTEIDTEAYLESEMRMLAMPDGETVPVRGIKLMWSIFDLLQQSNMFTQERLIEIAYSMAECEQVSFEKALESVCGYAHEQVKKW